MVGPMRIELADGMGDFMRELRHEGGLWHQIASSTTVSRGCNPPGFQLPTHLRRER